MTDAIFPDLKDASIFITGGGSGIGANLTEGQIQVLTAYVWGLSRR